VFSSYIVSIIPGVIEHCNSANSLLVNAATPRVHLRNCIVLDGNKVSVRLVKNVEWGLRNIMSV
jgi:hypothetical protein